ncbi:MAG TPA: flagellar export chaperone FliS [Campylobacterales bacterium]|nr:flagellar export chaperone FliS [Campylobacterales bacterium]
MREQAINAYAQNHAATTSPEKLIEMLYEGLLRFTTLAKRAIEAKDNEAKAKWLSRSSDIFIELIGSLKADGSEMTAYLTGLYIHQIKSLNEANITNSTKELNTIIHVVKVLLETWREETGLELEMA